jgi:hypothetical protein
MDASTASRAASSPTTTRLGPCRTGDFQRHRNPPDGDGVPSHWECWMRDPDGYTVVVAGPYGTADGAWRPGPDLFA